MEVFQNEVNILQTQLKNETFFECKTQPALLTTESYCLYATAMPIPKPKNSQILQIQVD